MSQMNNTVMVQGKRYVLIPETEYTRLKAGARVIVSEADLPPWPEALPSGNYDAIEYARISLARSIITDRKQMGWSQAELARAAGIRPEVLNRIEKAKVSADAATVAKIDKALARGATDERMDRRRAHQR